MLRHSLQRAILLCSAVFALFECSLSFVESFRGISVAACTRAARCPLLCVPSRREFLFQNIAVGTAVGTVAVSFPVDAASADTSSSPKTLSELTSTLRRARSQLDAVPAIIEKEEWDKVRAILITPPLSDCWTTSKSKSNLLLDVANAIGDADGDELAVLESREDATTHLRYLDMAVYNNVFNPIVTSGKTGATKELIRSYYEDPTNELEASKKALDDILTELSNVRK